MSLRASCSNGQRARGDGEGAEGRVFKERRAPATSRAPVPVVSSRPKIDFAERGEARIFGGRRALIVVACVVRRPKAAALVLRHSARSLLELAGEGKLDDIDERVTAPRHIRKFCEWKKMQSSSAVSLAVGRPLVLRGRSAPMCRRDVHKAQPNSGWAQTPQLSGAGKPIDLVSTAIRLGTSFVGGSFSSDKVQLEPLIKAAFQHKGAAIHRRSFALRSSKLERFIDWFAAPPRRSCNQRSSSIGRAASIAPISSVSEPNWLRICVEPARGKHTSRRSRNGYAPKWAPPCALKPVGVEIRAYHLSARAEALVVFGSGSGPQSKACPAWPTPL